MPATIDQLGPLWFLIFVNDLPYWVVNGISMFADYTKIWRGIYRVAVCQGCLESYVGIGDDPEKIREN